MPERTELGRFMYAEPDGRAGAPSWRICNKRHQDMLGLVEWNPRWREFVFSPVCGGVIFSADCLREIAGFLERQNAQKKEADCED